MKYLVLNTVLAVILLCSILFTQLCVSTTLDLVEKCKTVCEKTIDK